MLIIKHRVNSLVDLNLVPLNFGVELDLHFHQNQIFVGHDPGSLDHDFDSYLSQVQHRFLALNVKEEGIEELVLDCLHRHRIDKFFLFDLSFPSLIKLMNMGEKRLAIRISDFESVRNFDLIQDKVEWLWVDIFNNAEFLNQIDWSTLCGFKKCFVSPELHSKRKPEMSEIILQTMLGHVDKIDAICTKNESFWSSK